jgi:hypothetical protein
MQFKPSIFLLTACFFGTLVVHGEPLAMPALTNHVKLHGTVGVNYFSRSRDLDKKSNFYNAYAHLEVMIQPHEQIRLFSALQGVEGFLRDTDPEIRFRETYVKLVQGALEATIGKQIIVWGRADRINPTDQNTPWDYTLLLAEEDDLRSGRVAASLDYHMRSFMVSGIFLPEFRPNHLPLHLPPNVSVEEQLPAEKIENLGYAIKFDYSGKRLDASISYLVDHSLSPDLILKAVTPQAPGLPPSVHISKEYGKVHLLGADFAKPFKAYTFRGEIAYSRTQDPDGKNPEVKNPALTYVLGVDRTFLEDLYCNLQFIQKRIAHYEDLNEITDPIQKGIVTEGWLINDQIHRVRNALSLHLSRKWFHENLLTEISGIYNIPGRDYTIRPKVSYKITQDIKATVGADVFQGEANTSLGRLKANRTVYVDFRYLF